MSRNHSHASLAAGSAILLAVFLMTRLASAQPLPELIPAAPRPDAAPALHFVPNVGQFADPVRYQARGLGGVVWLTDDAIWITQLAKPAVNRRRWDERPRDPLALRGVNVRLVFEGAGRARLEPHSPQATRYHYYRGSDPAGWRDGVPAWGAVRYAGLYPGLSLEVGGGATGGDWLRFVCDAPCPADLSVARLRVDGAAAVRVAGDRLLLATDLGELALPLPRLVDRAGRVVPGAVAAVVGAEAVAPAAQETPDAALERGAAIPGVVSAEVYYGTLLGGSDMEWAEAIAADDQGRAVVVGDTCSPDFPTTPGAFDISFNGGDPWGDAYVARFRADGSGLEYATFLGGSAAEVGFGGALDGDGAVYLTGWTESGDFPTTPGAFDRTRNGDEDAFVARLDAQGELEYSTYLGGGPGHADPDEADYEFRPSGYDAGMAVVVDGREAVVAGTTRSPNFPTTPGAPDRQNETYCYDRYTVYPCADAFVARLSADGSALRWATFIGGAADDHAQALAPAGGGRVALAGDTFSPDFPLTGDAYDRTGGIDRDAFLTVVGRGGGLDYSTYLGGQQAAGDGWFEGDRALAVHVASDGRITVGGETWSSDFPTTPGAYDRTRQGGAG